uniref:HIT-type domain-containing protein n=1 Tax=Amblyomma triste TaxID=251400 RepID=A0A023GJ34_AMBTT
MQECGAPRPCKFCESALARYTCPRCNIGYCSVRCYKDARHRGCSEDFYKDWVHTYLRTEQASPEARQKMVDTLKAAQAEAEAEECVVDETAELVQRLEQTSIDVETAWNYLTEDEKQEFENLIKSGDAGRLVPVWKPWWEQVPLVTEVTTDSGQTGCCSVQPLSKLTSRAPAGCVVNSVLNVLCSYIHVVRLYNGEMIPQSADDLISTSTVLADDAVFCTAAEAVQAVLQSVIATQSGTTTEELQSLLNAVCGFLGSPKLPEHVLRALDETRSALEAATKVRGCERELKLRLRRAIKKVEYMMSWAAEHGIKLLSCISDVDIEAATVAMDMAKFEEARKRIEDEKAAKPKVLIEELN